MTTPVTYSYLILKEDNSELRSEKIKIIITLFLIKIRIILICYTNIKKAS